MKALRRFLVRWSLPRLGAEMKGDSEKRCGTPRAADGRQHQCWFATRRGATAGDPQVWRSGSAQRKLSRCEEPPLFEHLLYEFALRALDSGSPGFSTVWYCRARLGIGANTAIFTLRTPACGGLCR